MKGVPVTWWNYEKASISACLLGLNTRYDGESNRKRFLEMVKPAKQYLFALNRQGLPTPRDPSEIIGGDGRDVLKARLE